MSKVSLTPIGAVRYSLDDKNRVRMPAVTLDELGASIVMSPGAQGNLNIMSKETFDKKHESLFDADIYDVELQTKYSVMRSLSASVERDAQNRITVPENIKRIFGIDKEVVFIAKLDFVEMWPAQLYDSRPELMSADNISNIMQSLGKIMRDRALN